MKKKLQSAWDKFRSGVATVITRSRVSKDKMRMAQWLLLSIVTYAVVHVLANTAVDGSPSGLFPRLQAVLWKCAQLNLGAFLGYWISRTRLGRLTPASSDVDRLAHGVVIGCTMIALGMAL